MGKKVDVKKIADNIVKELKKELFEEAADPVASKNQEIIENMVDPKTDDLIDRKGSTPEPKSQQETAEKQYHEAIKGGEEEKKIVDGDKVKEEEVKMGEVEAKQQPFEIPSSFIHEVVKKTIKAMESAIEEKVKDSVTKVFQEAEEEITNHLEDQVEGSIKDKVEEVFDDIVDALADLVNQVKEDVAEKVENEEPAEEPMPAEDNMMDEEKPEETPEVNNEEPTPELGEGEAVDQGGVEPEPNLETNPEENLEEEKEEDEEEKKKDEMGFESEVKEDKNKKVVTESAEDNFEIDDVLRKLMGI